MGAYGNMDTAIAGLIAMNGDFKKVETNLAVQQSAGIAFGAPVWSYKGEEDKAYNTIQDVTKLAVSADLSASNSTIVTVNGVSTVAEVYGTSHAATIAAIVAKVTALTGVDCILDPADATSKTLLIRTKGTTCTASAATTSGSAVTWTATTQTDLVFRGIALFINKGVGSAYAGSSKYTQYEGISVLSRGVIYALTGAAMNAIDTAYLSLSTSLWGDSGMDLSCKVVSTVTGAGLAKIEVNGPVKPYTEQTWA